MRLHKGMARLAKQRVQATGLAVTGEVSGPRKRAGSDGDNPPDPAATEGL
jgi:hypothetical protein